MDMEKFRGDSEKQMIYTNKKIIDGKMQHDSLTKEVGHIWHTSVIQSSNLDANYQGIF